MISEAIHFIFQHIFALFCFPVQTSQVSFGTTSSRDLLPLKPPHTRAGNELGLRGQPNIGPGVYDNHVVWQNTLLRLCFLQTWLIVAWNVVFREARTLRGGTPSCMGTTSDGSLLFCSKFCQWLIRSPVIVFLLLLSLLANIHTGFSYHHTIFTLDMIYTYCYHEVL